MPRIILICSLFLATLLNTALAETYYVTDKLRLALYEEANNGGKQLRLLTSGDKLSLLNRTKFYAQVETEDGLIGWTKLGFLVDKVPPSFIAAKLGLEVESLTQRVEKAEEDQLLAQQQATEFEQQLTHVKRESEKNIATIKKLNNEQGTLLTNLSVAEKANQDTVPFTWLLYIGAATLFLGFLAGLWCLDAISRRNHGGYRIY